MENTPSSAVSECRALLMQQLEKTGLPYRSESFVDGVATLSAVSAEPLDVEAICAVFFGLSEDAALSDAYPQIYRAGVFEAFDAYEEEIGNSIDDETFEPCFVAGVSIGDVAPLQTVEWCRGFMAGLATCAETWLDPVHQPAYELTDLIGIMADEDHSPQERIADLEDGDTIWADLPGLIVSYVYDMYNYWIDVIDNNPEDSDEDFK